MFLSAATALLLVVYFFGAVVLEAPSVQLIRNKSRVYVRFFGYMEDIWIHVLNTTDHK